MHDFRRNEFAGLPRAAYGCGEYRDWLEYSSAQWRREERRNERDWLEPEPTGLEQERIASHEFIYGRCVRCGIRQRLASWSSCEEQAEFLCDVYVSRFQEWIDGGCELVY